MCLTLLIPLIEQNDGISENDLDLLLAMTLKTEDGLSEATYERMCYAFPKSHLPPFKVAKARLRFLSG